MKQVVALGILTWFAAAACIAGASPGKDSFQEGLSALKAGRYAEAIGAFSLAIEAVPHDYEALNNENGKPYRQTYAVRPGGRPEDIRDKIAALDGLIGFSPEGGLSTRGPKEQVVRTPPGIPVSIDLMRDAPEHAAWDVIMESVPLNGTLSGILPHLIYTPKPGFGGEDLFDYRLSDGSQSTHPIRVRIIVGLTEGAMPDEPGNAETVRSSAVHPEAVDPPLEEAPGADANPPAGEPAPAAEAADAQWLGSPAPEAASPTIQTPDAAEVEAAAPAPETPFAVQVQSFRQREAAEQVVRELNRAGHAAFHRIAAIPGRGNWHRVYVGPFATFEEAEQAKRRLSGGPHENAFVARLGRKPGPPHRITGPEGAGGYRNPYAFQVRSFTREEEARKLANRLRNRGRKAFIGQASVKEGESWYRVYIGAFSSPSMADTERSSLKDEELLSIFLVYLPYCLEISMEGHDGDVPELEARLTELGFAPYRLPAVPGSDRERLAVGGFHRKSDAAPMNEQLEAAGFTTSLSHR